MEKNKMKKYLALIIIILSIFYITSCDKSATSPTEFITDSVDQEHQTHFSDEHNGALGKVLAWGTFPDDTPVLTVSNVNNHPYLTWTGNFGWRDTYGHEWPSITEIRRSRFWDFGFPGTDEMIVFDDVTNYVDNEIFIIRPEAPPGWNPWCPVYYKVRLWDPLKINFGDWSNTVSILVN